MAVRVVEAEGGVIANRGFAVMQVRAWPGWGKRNLGLATRAARHSAHDAAAHDESRILPARRQSWSKSYLICVLPA